ncbi:M48 family metallopeptidase [Nitrincola tapanii]|uniref:M48 family peptidase n=1 Tax=Nitrincola tapanii TaxID=1708751 RepID=A0A5A9VZX0_9GAMM|nr:M48 family metallopeptidase [Nitrincola tapanii]KAA0873862.1 M48 family peptidase [Nitrincola tapanii]
MISRETFVRIRYSQLLLLILFTVTLSACATSPTGRSQFTMFSDQQINAMGAANFEQMRQEKKTVTNAEVRRYAQCVTDALLAVSPDPHGWEVEVFAADTPNAFALPGKKIGLYQGMLNLAQTPAQLAAVVGHEIGHVLARHGNERVSTQYATQMGLALATAVFASGERSNDQLLAALGLGAQVGILLPFSRQHEIEADLMGLELMARAGFDPRESITLWQNMSRQGSGNIEFLSTHPGYNTRIQTLQRAMPDALNLYEQAQQAGRKPSCRRPGS